MENNVRPETMARINTKALAEAFIAEQVAEIQAQVGDKKVLLALSGGVDSSVVAALLNKAVGKQLVCVHVNHGLMRKGESEQVIEVFEKQLDANLIYVDATERFLSLLAGVEEPERKRKIIGGEFIKVFDEEASKLKGISFLAQGTIYPDILESDGVKAHHNVGGLPEDMQFELVEPLKFLYKDEVRMVGSALGLPDGMVYRQPFPGPGLGVRCLGAITRDRLCAPPERWPVHGGIRLRPGGSADRLRANRRPLLQHRCGNAPGLRGQAGGSRVPQRPEGRRAPRERSLQQAFRQIQGTVRIPRRRITTQATRSCGWVACSSDGFCMLAAFRRYRSLISS